MDFKSQIKNYIIDNFLYGQNDDALGDDVSFLESGIIDSTGVLELVSYIQDACKIVVTDDELIPDNFDSVNKLATFIIKKQAMKSKEHIDASETTVLPS